jgi:hypothetical protein
MKPTFKSAAEYINYLEDTLIPDLKKAGSDATAQDFEEAIHWMKEPVRFAVFLDGGLVQEVYTDRPSKMIKIDLDIEGADEDEITEYPDRANESCKGFISIDDSCEQSILEEDAEYVERLFKSQDV